MIRTTLLATAVASIFSLSAFAQTGPRLVGEGDNPHVVYDVPSNNIVGSADATVTGPSDQAEYVTRRVFQTQRPTPNYQFGVNQPWQLETSSHG
ncbi:hypothetical protein [Roseococcus pinisoli]|uniref:Uncharacterized protein n=1 Tax=Roseococcus pinisoli TaxID=2835040 RepID=A0ABS5QDU3_9PROT|nr:hypothetical protein [Roseococcus pinisoli]MBS7811087.1 hypothetical protein [Roseococcus pinisoli]